MHFIDRRLVDSTGLARLHWPNNNDLKWPLNARTQQLDCVEELSIALLPNETTNDPDDGNERRNTQTLAKSRSGTHALERWRECWQVDAISEQMQPVGGNAKRRQLLNVFDVLH